MAEIRQPIVMRPARASKLAELLLAIDPPLRRELYALRSAAERLQRIAEHAERTGATEFVHLADGLTAEGAEVPWKGMTPRG